MWVICPRSWAGGRASVPSPQPQAPHPCSPTAVARPRPHAYRPSRATRCPSGPAASPWPRGIASGRWEDAGGRGSPARPGGPRGAGPAPEGALRIRLAESWGRGSEKGDAVAPVAGWLVGSIPAPLALCLGQGDTGRGWHHVVEGHRVWGGEEVTEPSSCKASRSPPGHLHTTWSAALPSRWGWSPARPVAPQLVHLQQRYNAERLGLTRTVADSLLYQGTLQSTQRLPHSGCSSRPSGEGTRAGVGDPV